jgi:hypothetical protein
VFKYLFTLFLLFSTGTIFAQEMVEETAEKLAQEQLEAYNKRDIDAFVAPYAEKVRVYKFPDEFMYEGKTEMYDIYGRMFARTPDLHCKLVNRIVMGNTVIDHEEVTISKNEPPMKAIAIYKIKDGKIAEVYFIQ